MAAHALADHSPGLVRTLCKAFGGGQPTPPSPSPRPLPTAGSLSRYCPHAAASPWLPRPPSVRALGLSPPSRPARESCGRAGPWAASRLSSRRPTCLSDPSTRPGPGCPGARDPALLPEGPRPGVGVPTAHLRDWVGPPAGGRLLLHLEAKSRKCFGRVKGQLFLAGTFCSREMESLRVVPTT